MRSTTHTEEKVFQLWFMLCVGFCVSLFSFNKATAQCVELVPLEVVNPGFEGPTAPHQTPAPWSTCGITPDTQPGSWGVNQPPSEGSSYVGFVHDGAGWQEGASQQLSGSMQTGISYTFTIDLSASPASGGGLNPNNHCSMEVWGADGICQLDELLWSSPMVTHNNWQEYEVTITPSQNWRFIYFISNCEPMGYILLDNITPLQANNPNVFITSHMDGDAENCSFQISGNVNDAVIDSVVLTGNFQESPLTTTMNGLDWSGMVSFNGSGTETIRATAYYLDQQFQETCVYAEVELDVNAPTAAFTFASECQTDPVQFTDNSAPFGAATITSWNWDFGDGNTSSQPNPSHAFANEGTYSVELEIETSDGCAVATTEDVEIYEVPVADFTFNEACEGDPTDFTDASVLNTGNIQSWNWNFDNGNTSTDQNPTESYTTLGTYDVTLEITTDNGCSHSFTQEVGMYPNPEADFSSDDACLQTDFGFTDESSVLSGSVDEWEWDFGDGNTATDQNPTNAYQADGTFDVTLNVTTDRGCSDVTTDQVTVHPLPVADFNNTTVCALINMDYTDASSVTSGTVDAWQWHFGDGEESTDQDPTHIFGIGNTYTTSLVVTTNFGCQDSVASEVTVHPKPVAEFSAPDVCLDEPTDFTDESTFSGTPTSEWEWDFDDIVGTSIDQNPTYTFGSSGTFDVELIATTQDGCKDTISHAVEVFDLPVADFQFASVCEDDSAQFTDLSTIPSGAINSWLWDFGNGESATEEVPSHQHFPGDGFYDVSLIVASGNGCSDTIEDEIEIYPVPIADFTFDSVCYPLQVTFTDLSEPNGAYDIDTWAWSFTDGQTSALSSPSVGLGAAGTIGATLLITNDAGCKSTKTDGDAVVHPLPVAEFPDTLAVCLEETVYFSENSEVDPITDDTIVHWNWNFDDGNSAAIPEPSHLYQSHNIYNVNLEVTTNHSCSDDVTHQVEIYPLPQVSFITEPPQGCAPLNVQFIDQSSIPSPYLIAEWDWYLGADTMTSDLPSPFLQYDPELEPLDVETYDIGLTLTSGNGCVSSVYHEEHLTIYPKPDAEFEVDEEVKNILKPKFEFTDLSTENVVLWNWTFGDGAASAQQNPVHTYGHAGEFPVELLVETQFGCKDTTGIMVKVEPVFTFYIPNSFTPDNNGINEEFYGQGEGYDSYFMQIYDRWGELIFESADDTFHWDGTFRGQQVQQGTYIYYFRIVDWENHEHEYRGHVTLHR